MISKIQNELINSGMEWLEINGYEDVAIKHQSVIQRLIEELAGGEKAMDLILKTSNKEDDILTWSTWTNSFIF